MYRRACVKWCPQNDYMVVVGSDVQAFRAMPSISPEEDRLGVLTRRSFAPLSLSAEVQQTTSAEWDPVKHDSSARLAVGTTGGRMILMEASPPGTRRSLCREYSPLSSVECLDLAWNPMATNQVAMGLNNGGTPSCGLVLWDLESSQGAAAADAALMGTRSGGVPPVWSTLRGSAVASVDWRPNERHQLLAGLASTWVKLMDTRSSTPSLSLAVHEEHRRIVDVRVDPWNPLRFFSVVADGTLKVWDIRHHRARRPLALIPPERRPSPFLEAAWSPLHPGRVLVADGSPAVVSLWDMTNLDLEPSSTVSAAWSGRPTGTGAAGASGGGAADPWASRGEDGKVASAGALPSHTLREPLLQRALGADLVGFSWLASRVAQPPRPGRGCRVAVVTTDGLPADVALQSAHPVTFSAHPTSKGPTVGLGRAIANPTMATSLSSWFAPDVAIRYMARLEQGVGVDAGKNEAIFANACQRLRHTGERASSLALAARLLGAKVKEDDEDGEAEGKTGPSERQLRMDPSRELRRPRHPRRPEQRYGGDEVAATLSATAAAIDRQDAMSARAFWSTDQAMSSPFIASVGAATAADGHALLLPLALPPSRSTPAADADRPLGEVDAGCGEGVHGGRDKILLPGSETNQRLREEDRGERAWQMAADRGGSSSSNNNNNHSSSGGNDSRGNNRVGGLFADTNPHEDTVTTAIDEADVRYEMYRQARDVHDLRAAWAFVRATTECVTESPADPSIGHGVMAHLEEERSYPDSTEESHVGPFVGYTCVARQHILALCGWASERQTLAALCESSVASAGKERAAAMAVFHGDISLALTLLQSAVSDRSEEASALAEARVRGASHPAWTPARGDQLRRAERLVQQEKECLQMVTMALVGFPGVGAAPPLAEERASAAANATNTNTTTTTIATAVGGRREGDARAEAEAEGGGGREGAWRRRSPSPAGDLGQASQRGGGGGEGNSPTARGDEMREEGEEGEEVVEPELATSHAEEDAPVTQAGSLWRRLCRQLIVRMDREHPYLRAMCAFLLAQADPAVRKQPIPNPASSQDATRASDWRASPLVGVLTERGIRLADRVAIGAQFLGPLAFPNYVEALMDRATKAGFVDGLLLTGLGSRGVALLQSYVNRTGDTQMAALLSCFVPPSRVHRRSAQRMMMWIHACVQFPVERKKTVKSHAPVCSKSYRDLLNRWRLWRVRAYFDIGRSKQMRALVRVPAEEPAPAHDDLTPSGRSSFDAQRMRQLQQDFVGSDRTPKVFNLRGSSARERLTSRTARSTATFSRGLRARSAAGGTATAAAVAASSSLRAAVTRSHDLGGGGGGGGGLHAPSPSAARAHGGGDDGGTGGGSGGPGGSGGVARDKGEGDPAARALLLRTLTHHPQLHLVCQCGQSQALPSLIKSETIGRPYVGDQFPPILLTCPKCKNRLPRCALCLLGMGSINPLLERNHQSATLRQGTRTGHRGTALEAEHPTRRSALNFAEHWTWCQACQHGGHASHLAEWFASHDVCPVSGCRCRCKLRDRAVVPWNESLLGPMHAEREV